VDELIRYHSDRDQQRASTPALNTKIGNSADAMAVADNAALATRSPTEFTGLGPVLKVIASRS
jgi:hypothetical protein